MKEHSDVDGNASANPSMTDLNEDEEKRKIRKVSTWCKEDRLNFYSAVSYVGLIMQLF